MYHYTVRRHLGRPLVFEDDAPRPTVMYCPGDAFGNDSRQDVDNFLAAGVTDFYLWAGRDETEQDGFTTPFWRQVSVLGEPRFESAQRFLSLPEKVAYILERCPEARFLIRYYAHAPKSWKDAYPEELAVDEEGHRRSETSLASARYEADHGKFLQHMIRWIESQPWSWRVMGYLTLHEWEGTTGFANAGLLFDYSAPMLHAFREKYPGRLSIPRNRFAVQRRRGGTPHWPPPEEIVVAREYFDVVRSLFLKRCRNFVETVQRATNGRQVLIGMDALKQGMQGWICEPFFFGQRPRSHHAHMHLASGSVGADEFLKIPGFNVLNTPYDYIFRHAGGSPEPEGIVDSSVLRGQLFLAEDDARTHACSEGEQFGYFRDDAEVEAGLWRNAAAAISRGYQFYWMDVTGWPSPRGGYFRDDFVMRTIANITSVLRQSIAWPHADVPGIAMIIDDRSASHEDFSSGYQDLAVMWQRLGGLGQAGVPYRIYLWEDILADNFPDHRLFIFPDLFLLNEERIHVLRERVLGRGRTVLWGPGTGITDGSKLSGHWGSLATGFPLSLHNETYSRRVVLTRGDHPITAPLDGATCYGDSAPYGPILLPERDGSFSEQGIVLTARGVNRPGLAIKQMEGPQGPWTSIFTAAVPVPTDLIREMARHGGAHVYSEANDVILASEHFLAIHSSRAGTRTFKLPSRKRVRDAVSNSVVAETDQLTLQVDPPQTRLFFLEPFA